MYNEPKVNVNYEKKLVFCRNNTRTSITDINLSSIFIDITNLQNRGF